MSKVVKTQSKGMVTIPREYREKLGIEGNCLMEVKIIDDSVVFKKIGINEEKTEIYSDSKIQKWLKEDKIDSATVAKIKKLLK